VTASSDGSIWMWNGNSGQNLAVFTGHEKPVNQVNFTPDGKKVTSISEDQTMRIWNPKSLQCEFKIFGYNFH
jgi:WD40 repeat protein